MNRSTLVIIGRIVLTAATATLPGVVVGAVVTGLRGAVIGLGVGFLVIALAWSGSRPILMRACQATGIDRSTHRDLVDLVNRLASEAGIATPRITVSALRTPNALAAVTPGGGLISVTAGAVELLSPAELRAVLAHEIAHLTRPERAIATVAAVIATLPGMIATATGGDLFYDRAFRRAHHRRWGGRFLRPVRDGVALAGMLATSLIVRHSTDRHAEIAADHEAVRLTGEPASLAFALRKIDALAGRIVSPVNPAVSHLLVIHPYSSPRLGRMFYAHPPLSERLSTLAAGDVSSGVVAAAFIP